MRAGPDFAGLGCGVEQSRADGHQAVEEVGVQRVEAAAVRLQRLGKSVLSDQEINEQVNPLPECCERRVSTGQPGRAGLGAGLDLVAVDGDDEVRPSREVAVDRPDPDTGPGRDLTDRRVDAGGDEHRCSLDRSKVAVAGHSMGGHTASLLLGARLTDPHDGTDVNLAESRIKAGVLLAAPGRGGDALSEFAAEHYPFFSTMDFSEMTTPALVVAGDKDASAHLTVRARTGTPIRTSSPRPQVPAHPVRRRARSLGGVAGYDAAETTDEDPQRVAAVQRLTCAYLRAELYPGDSVWHAAGAALTTSPNPPGRVES